MVIDITKTFMGPSGKTFKDLNCCIVHERLEKIIKFITKKNDNRVSISWLRDNSWVFLPLISNKEEFIEILNEEVKLNDIS